MIIRVPVFFKLIITLTLFSSVALGQDGYESPVLDDDESFTQAFQKRINESGTAAPKPVQQTPVQQTAPVKQPAPTMPNRGGLLERSSSANQQKGKSAANAPAANPAENNKAAKSSWWQFWKKKGGKDNEPETAPSDSVTPQQSTPQAPSNVPRYDQPAPTAYQNVNAGNSVANPPVSPTAQYEAARANGQGYASKQADFGAPHVQSGTDLVGTHIRTATGPEMKPTAQADVQMPQYDWSQSRFDSMRAGNLPGQQPFQAYDGAKIVAKVENAVILENDVQAGVKKRIAKMQREAKKNGATLTESDLQREIQMWQVQALQELIQHHVMFTKACASIPKENLENVKAAVDKAFDDKQLPTMIKEYGVASQWELEQALKAEGSCIENEKKKFFEQSIGIQWLQMQADPVKEIRHDQIMDYYNKHIDQYTITPKARWEELVVFKYQFSSREEAYKAIQKMGQAVVAGKPFAEVAKQSSQGATASDGGKRDWVSPGALNSEPLNKALFEQPVGDLSPRIIEDENCFYIVRVLERHGKRMVPFEEAQTEIRKKLTDEQEEENRKKAFEKVFSEAKITILGAEQTGEKSE